MLADNLVLGILIGIASGIAALIVIAAVTLRRFDAARHSESVRLQRTLADLQRTVRQELGALRRDFDGVAGVQERHVETLTERLAGLTDGAVATVRQEVATVRQDVAAAAGRQSEHAEGLADRLAGLGEGAVATLRHELAAAASRQQQQDEAFANRVTELGDSAVAALRQELADAASRHAQQGEALASRVTDVGDGTMAALRQELAAAASRHEQQSEALAERLAGLGQEAVTALRDHPLPALTRLADVQEQKLGELATELMRLSEAMAADAAGHAKDLRNELLESLKLTLDEFRAAHAAQVEQVRASVDEKLESTVEQRLGESFRLVGERLALVSDRLDHVHQGLGEVQSFAAGLGHLQRAVATVRLGGNKPGVKGAEANASGVRIRGPRRKPVTVSEETVETSQTSSVS
jgi:hypothetical protein